MQQHHRRAHRAWRHPTVMFSPNGQLLASASYDNTVRLWDGATGALRGRLEGHTDCIRAVTFSPNFFTRTSRALNTVNNLGILYKDQGKHSEAEQMHRRALDGYEKAWGPEHPSTLSTINNLGNLYQDQGKHGEAEQMYR